MSRLISILFLIFAMPGLAWGAGELNIEADHVEKTKTQIEAQGSVIINDVDMSLTCSYVLYDESTGDIWATGDCYLKDPKGEIRASSIAYNRVRQDAHIENGSIFLYQQPLKLSGDSITRYANDIYIGKNLTYTPCLAKTPAWSIKADSIDIPLEGYGKAEDARLRIQDIPVMYFPGMLFPAKLKRQSGLLLPEIHSSSDTGFTYVQPVFVTLGRSADITLIPTYYTERGALAAADLRYVLDNERRGRMYAEYLHDKLGGETSKGGTVLPERPSDRWFLEASQAGGHLIWDVNLVSNPDYFRDIGTLYTQDNQSLWIGQQAQRTEEQISRIQWSNAYGPLSVGVSSQWKQNLTVEALNNGLQEIPRLEGYLAQSPIPHTPITYAANFNTVRLTARDWTAQYPQGNTVSEDFILTNNIPAVRDAIKDNAYIEFSLPYSIRPYFTLRPFLQEFYRDTRMTEQKNFDHSLYAENWQVRGITLNTALYSSRFYEDWYHQIVPGVSWTTRTRVGGNYDTTDPADFYPQLLADDNWFKQDDILFSVSNYIRNTMGDPIMEISLNRPFNRLTDQWGLYQATVRLTPNPYVGFEHLHTFGSGTDPITGKVYQSFATQQHTTTLNVRDTRGDEFAFGEEYNRLDTMNMYGRAKINMGKGFGLLGEARFDFITNRFLFTRQGLSYNSQCWGITLRYDVEPMYEDPSNPLNNTSRTTTAALTVTLLGLGDVSTHRGIVGP